MVNGKHSSAVPVVFFYSLIKLHWQSWPTDRPAKEGLSVKLPFNGRQKAERKGTHVAMQAFLSALHFREGDISFSFFPAPLSAVKAPSGGAGRRTARSTSVEGGDNTFHCSNVAVASHFYFCTAAPLSAQCSQFAPPDSSDENKNPWRGTLQEKISFYFLLINGTLFFIYFLQNLHQHQHQFLICFCCLHCIAYFFYL